MPPAATIPCMKSKKKKSTQTLSHMQCIYKTTSDERTLWTIYNLIGHTRPLELIPFSGTEKHLVDHFICLYADRAYNYTQVII